jgi:hypothetical protein
VTDEENPSKTLKGGTKSRRKQGNHCLHYSKSPPDIIRTVKARTPAGYMGVIAI